MVVGGGEQTSIVEAPALAELARLMHESLRYRWQWERPFEVDPMLWHRANAEIEMVQEARGFPVQAADWVPLPNFLLMGVPIVMGDD